MEHEQELSDYADVSVPRLFLSATGRGVGLSTAVLGIIVALRKEKVGVAVGKTGSYIIQTTHYRRISGRLSHTLSPWMLTPEQMRESVARLSSGAEILLVEGDRGLLDQCPPDYTLSTEAEFAELLSCPVVLVINAKGYAESIAALIHGFRAARTPSLIRGVICNRVADEAHNALLRGAVEALGEVAYIGGLPEADLAALDIKTDSESSGPLSRSQYIALGELAEKHLDLKLLQTIAAQATPYQVARTVVQSKPRSCRIAVADDMAFYACFQSNLDLLRRNGAELTAFSPLVDGRLPQQIQAVYLPGGPFHRYAQDLSANSAMLKALNQFARSGGIILAEGSAIAYLLKHVTLAGDKKLPMVGLIPGSGALLSEVLSGEEKSFVEIHTEEENLLSIPGETMRGFREYRWAIRLEQQVPSCFELRERRIEPLPEDAPALRDGFRPLPNVLATTVHAQWASCPQAAQRFISAASGAFPLK